MSKPNYRVSLTFDGERKLFLARCPELEHCTAEGATRAEAIGKLEEEIDAQLANMLSHGTQPPRSVDEEEFTGQVSGKVSKLLHRDLVFQARSEGIEIDQLLSELLASAMESRKTTHRGHRSGNRQPQDHMPHDNVGNRHDGGGNRPQRGFGGRGHNPQLLDDRATFIEYVRGLEQGGGHGGHNRGPGGHGGPRGDGPGGDGRRRRGRGGRGGGGGNPNYRNDRPMQGQGYNGGPRNGGPPNQGNGQGHHQSNEMSAGPAPQAPHDAPPSQGGNGGGNDSEQ
jgi:predicted RNase H-like HicB family nuclease